MKGGSNMYVPIGIKTDYSLLKSLIRIPELIKFLIDKNVTTAGILDDNLFGSMCFYNECIKNNIKPIIGLKVNLSTGNIYLYAKNYNGFQNLLKINTLLQEREVNYIDLKSHSIDVIGVLPYKNINIYEQVRDIFKDFYLAYGNDYEKKNSLIKHDKCVYINEVCVFSFEDVKYMKILRNIESVEDVDLQEYSDSYLDREVNEDYVKSTIDFGNLIDIEIPKNGKYIPHYDSNIEDSYQYLCNLCKKGLEKRLEGSVSKEYSDRLLMELNVINNMGFVDYFLIVYDYVKFAKKNNILVGPGSGSAAGGLLPRRCFQQYHHLFEPRRCGFFRGYDYGIDIAGIDDPIGLEVLGYHGCHRIGGMSGFGTAHDDDLPRCGHSGTFLCLEWDLGVGDVTQCYSEQLRVDPGDSDTEFIELVHGSAEFPCGFGIVTGHLSATDDNGNLHLFGNVFEHVRQFGYVFCIVISGDEDRPTNGYHHFLHGNQQYLYY